MQSDNAGGYSKEYSRLNPEHLKLIRDSAIAPEVSRERGYRTESVKARLGLLGFSPVQRLVPGMLTPLYDARHESAGYQFRPNEPRLDEKGRPIKYETPYRSRLVIDVPPSLSRPRKIDLQTPFDPAELPPMISDVSVPLIVTEGVRKADSAVSRGLCAIALMGVAAWHRLPDWNDFPLKGRTIYLCFDSDAMTKRQVWIQLRDLKAWLESHGAIVKIIYLPPGPHGEKSGSTIGSLVASRKGSMTKPCALVSWRSRPTNCATSSKAMVMVPVTIIVVTGRNADPLRRNWSTSARTLASRYSTTMKTNASLRSKSEIMKNRTPWNQQRSAAG